MSKAKMYLLREIKKILQTVIEEENKKKPLTDDKIIGYVKRKRLFDSP